MTTATLKSLKPKRRQILTTGGNLKAAANTFSLTLSHLSKLVSDYTRKERLCQMTADLPRNETSTLTASYLPVWFHILLLRNACLHTC